MGMMRIHFISALGLVLFCGLGISHAKETSKPGETIVTTTGGDDVIDTGTGTGAGAGKMDQASRLLGRMNDQVRRVQQLFTQAEKDSDSVKRNCLAPKMDGMNEAIATAKSALSGLRAALASRESVTADNEYRKVYDASLKCDQLATQAESCMGAVYTGNTKVKTVVEKEKLPQGETAENIPSLLSDNKTGDDDEEGDDSTSDVDRPVCASCYQ